ncbi:hypothetical protein JCM9140_2286 [Halalkalibacter wakoensis JCM 9140]|uniref:Uncharacterized protein n=1 Tax=Halalkalibacter wakoensis JCM 9140 TaxID=1236970 RepID=W4Q2N1_9BACI|nr:hypothetical protein [Halalkalibacter wakoensis]GAE26247.1 hypothetical protein JCM9140_2286 [Halalkalibacter wakoensis JCM 9140]
MEIIQSLADIESLRVREKIPLELITEIEKDFLSIYEAEGNETYLMDFRLSTWRSLHILEKGDRVAAKIGHSLELEYVELCKLKGLEYYRCAVRNDQEFQLFYSIVGTHDPETEEWLLENGS